MTGKGTWVLAVMPVKIKLELLRDTLGVNGGRDTDAAFTWLNFVFFLLNQCDSVIYHAALGV